jgi:hypothetical protein
MDLSKIETAIADLAKKGDRDTILNVITILSEVLKYEGKKKESVVQESRKPEIQQKNDMISRAARVMDGVFDTMPRTQQRYSIPPAQPSYQPPPSYRPQTPGFDALSSYNTPAPIPQMNAPAMEIPGMSPELMSELNSVYSSAPPIANNDTNMQNYAGNLL